MAESAAYRHTVEDVRVFSAILPPQGFTEYVSRLQRGEFGAVVANGELRLLNFGTQWPLGAS